MLRKGLGITKQQIRKTKLNWNNMRINYSSRNVKWSKSESSRCDLRWTRVPVATGDAACGKVLGAERYAESGKEHMSTNSNAEREKEIDGSRALEQRYWQEK